MAVESISPMMKPEQIWSSSSLATVPTVAVRLLELSRRPETEISDVVKTVKSDPAISARILKASNSSYFGFRSEVLTIDRAVPLLGTSVVTTLALGFSLMDDNMQPGPLADAYRSYWLHSISQAAAAELFVELLDEPAPESFQAGLLVDIGRLAMLKTLGEKYLPVIETCREDHRPLSEVEREMLGFDHTEIGLGLAKRWNLPLTLQTCILLHHAPLTALLEYETDANFRLYATVAVAAAAGDYFCADNKGQALERIRTLMVQLFGFSDQQIEEFLEQARPKIDNSAAMFDVNAASIASPRMLLAEAMEQLAEIAIRAQIESALAKEREQAFEREREELKRHNDRLQQQVLRDPLTKLFNRSYFDETLATELHRSRRAESPIGVIFADIDHFKKLNDTYGHPFGDLVLQRVAEALLRHTRASDTVARYGGEEFIILAPSPTFDGLETLAENLRRNIECMAIECDGKPVALTMSVGGAYLELHRGSDILVLADRLIQTADNAMYESKHNGRNRVTLSRMVSDVADDCLHQPKSPQLAPVG